MGYSVTITYTKLFLKYCDRLLGYEGNYVNNPEDPGGETKWGISKRSYPDLNIATLSKEKAIEIYWKDFWLVIEAEHFSDAVSWQVFDFAVNSGIQTVIRIFQRSLGVADDGYWGPVSRNAVKATNESDIIVSLLAERLDYMTRLSNWNSASRGWARRIAQNLRYAKKDTSS